MFDVDPDIRLARTPPASFYREVHTRLLGRAWHLAPAFAGPEVGQLQPFVLGAAPVVLARTDAGVRCLSNVCTHRANVIVDGPGCSQALRCRYHGRRFGLDGRFVSMPEFATAADFPTREDDLPVVPTGELGPLVFASLDPASSFEQLVAPVRARTAFLPWERLVYAGARDYDIAAHWALYVENYLEGFHIPFVHAGLNQVIEYDDYRTETFDHGNVQIGIASGDPATAFTLPPDHPDAGQRVAAWYFWLFPTTMINVYPWGLSLNAVTPLAPDRTRVTFVTWIWDLAQRDRGAGADLHTVELEDEVVVENVQRGIGSPLYHRGRYSPTREIGVHHFHRLAVSALASGGGV